MEQKKNNFRICNSPCVKCFVFASCKSGPFWTRRMCPDKARFLHALLKFINITREKHGKENVAASWMRCRLRKKEWEYMLKED